MTLTVRVGPGGRHCVLLFARGWPHALLLSAACRQGVPGLRSRHRSQLSGPQRRRLAGCAGGAGGEAVPYVQPVPDCAGRPLGAHAGGAQLRRPRLLCQLGHGGERGGAQVCAQVPGTCRGCSMQGLAHALLQRVKWEAKQASARVKLPWSKPATEFVAFSDSFHGRTMGALALTWKARRRARAARVRPAERRSAGGLPQAVRAADARRQVRNIRRPGERRAFGAPRPHRRSAG